MYVRFRDEEVKILEKTVEKSSKARSSRTLKDYLIDLKYLVKSIVLIANVLPVVAGFWLALHFTDTSFLEVWDVFVLTMIGSLFIVAGALILNNWFEVDLDTNMARTQRRPTVTGNIPMKVIFNLGIIASILGIIFMLMVNLEAAIYAFLGWFTYVVLYTFWSKRKYTLNTVIGSISGGFTPLIGWAAIDSAYHIVPLMLFILLFVWQIPHTFVIAMRRHDEYKAAGVPMLPVVAGFAVTKRQIAIYILALLPIPMFLASLGMPFVIAATLLNVVWLIYALRGFFVKDDIEWANKMFYFSLTYLSIMFILMIIATLPIFQ